MTQIKTANEIYQSLGSNEKAIIDKIKIPILRSLLIHLVATKLKLQFTGWLQYLIPITPTLIIVLIGGVFYLLGADTIALFVSYLVVLILFKVIFDIIIIKFKIRPPESLPGRKDDLSVFDLMLARRSCRSYQSRNLTSSDFQELMTSVKKHTQTQILAKTPVRIEYIKAPITVWPVVNAHEFLVAIVPAEYHRLAVIEVGICLQNIVIDATRMGLGTCWIGPGADQKSIQQHLGDKFNPQQDAIICVCAVGYKSFFTPLFISIFNRLMARRRSLSELFYHSSSMETPIPMASEPYNQFQQVFEACRWAPSSYNGQTTRCIPILNNDKKIERFDFYAVTASRYYAAVAIGIWMTNWQLGCKELDIKGHFSILPDKEGESSPPRYDVSWIMDSSTSV